MVDQHLQYHAIVMVIHHIVHLMDDVKYVLLLCLWIFFVLLFSFLELSTQYRWLQLRILRYRLSR